MEDLNANDIDAAISIIAGTSKVYGSNCRKLENLFLGDYKSRLNQRRKNEKNRKKVQIS